MIKKNILIISLILLLSSCGFTPIYLSNKNVDFSIEQVGSLIGQTLANDTSDDYGTLGRERKGLERLRDLEAPSDIHKWIFDISKASSGPLEPPELEHPLVDRLNERQEWAVRSALAAPDVYFIQGPPGTGKTTVIAELVNQITQMT